MPSAVLFLRADLNTVMWIASIQEYRFSELESTVIKVLFNIIVNCCLATVFAL